MKFSLRDSARILTFVCAFITLALLAGCGGGGGGGSTSVKDTSAPVLSNPVASTLTSSGGTVTLCVNATDDVGVKSVKATIKLEDDVLSEKTMSLESGSTYVTTYSAAANYTSSPVTYTVVFEASDAAGSESNASIEFDVPANIETPPGPPAED